MKIVGTHFKKILISAHYSHTADKAKQALQFYSVTVFQ